VHPARATSRHKQLRSLIVERLDNEDGWHVDR
jgi:hypothetical protein